MGTETRETLYVESHVREIFNRRDHIGSTPSQENMNQKRKTVKMDMEGGMLSGETFQGKKFRPYESAGCFPKTVKREMWLMLKT